MKDLLTSFIFLLLVHASFSQSNNSFYYAFDDQINLNPVTNRFTVEFIATADTNVFASNNIQYEYLTSGVYEVEGDLDTLQSIGEGIFKINQIYDTDGGARLYLKNSVILQWNTVTSSAEIDNIISQHNLVEKKKTRLYTIYEANIPLLTSQMIYETGLVRYSHPVFITEIERTDHIPNDEYFSHQWYLHNTGQEVNDGLFGTADADIDAPEAWDITFGSPDVVIAVIDGGITSDHPDLPNSRQLRLPGSNLDDEDGFANDDPSPSPDSVDIVSNHGNACAGIIAAEMDNNEGVTGIAPLCKILPAKLPFYRQFQSHLLADAITFAAENGADIISNSWTSHGTEENPNAFPGVIVAIEDAIAQGVVVIFSAGNTARHESGDSGGVLFPGNAEIPQMITVGASDRHDFQTNYSPTDTEIDLAAPSHTAYHYPLEGEAQNIWTIDIPDSNGYNTWDRPHTGLLPVGVDPLPPLGEELPDFGTNNLSYTGRFGGTSASAPMVAGVVALMLSVNPCLSVDQILDILYNTSEKVGGYDYNWNTDQLGHSLELGYGRVNAHLAVQAAQDLVAQGLDLYIKDTPDDFGAEPNETSQLLWVSEDIWVRNQPDGVINQAHQNPEYSSTDPVYVYVRVRNKGCDPSSGSEELNLYWAKAATALTWPEYWNGSITDPALMGDTIGSQIIDVIPAGEEHIVEFEWFPPNPNDYQNINDQPWHFCLLSRIVATDDPMNNEISNGTWNLGHNVKQNNNIAWKNLSIVDVIPGIAGGGWDDDKIVGASVAVGNASGSGETFQLDFIVPQHLIGDPITRTAEVRITLDDATWQKWANGGFQRQNIDIYNASRKQLIVKKANARLDNLSYGPYERSLINLSFNFLTREISNKYRFEYHAVQRKVSTGQILGGEKYIVKFPPRQSFTADAGADQEILASDSTILSATEISEDAIYNWYDAEGNLISSGKELIVAPEFTKKYKLEIIAESDGFKDYDEVEIKVNKGLIESITPNPATTAMNISYDIQSAASAYLMLTSSSTGITNNYILDLNSDNITLDVSQYAFGIYGLILVVDGQMVDQEGLVIE